MGADRRRLIGAALALALALVALWQIRSCRPTRRPSTAVTSGRGVATPEAPARVSGSGELVPVVALDILRTPRPEPAEAGRDPFRFESRREAPAPVTSAGRQGGRLAGHGSGLTRGGPAGATDLLTPAPPPPIPLKFIGVVRQTDGNVVIAVLSDSSGVYHGREGDIIEGQYRILRITDDLIEMAYVDGRGRQTIRLSGA
jgi:hypothetical protein